MPTENGNIRNYFQPRPQPSTVPVAAGPLQDETVKTVSSQPIIKSSDDEDSNSDSSFEDLSNLLQSNRNNSPKSPPRDDIGSSRTTRPRKNVKSLSFPASPVAAKPKYKFDLKTLIKQAKIEEATEASALRVKNLLESKQGTTDPYSENDSARDIQNKMLESVITDQEGTSIDRVLQAVKRTEATQTEKTWYFFDSAKETIYDARPVPSGGTGDSWKEKITDPQWKGQYLLSGLARDMVQLGDTLPDELFLWMLDEICVERRDDLREAYFRILEVSITQIQELIQSTVIFELFENLGAKDEAINVNKELNPVATDASIYDGRDWAIVRTIIAFLGRVSKYLSSGTKLTIMLFFTRLCVDSVVYEDIGLLAAVQTTLEQISESMGVKDWEQMSSSTCRIAFHSVRQASLQLQLLRCIPSRTPRLHELRRCIALAFFFNDLKHRLGRPHALVDLWEITQYLDRSEFKVNRNTDYHRLAAQTSILDIAIDNGLSSNREIVDPKCEREFNEDVDALAARIKQIWSSINDAGAAFMSRIDAKEVMEALRQRLVYAVRTRPRPRQSVFDPVPDDSEGVLKQSQMMSRHFKPKVEQP